MRVLKNEPGNWRDLQNVVARLFEESGYTVEIEKLVPNARGQAEIDVFVNPHHGFFQSIICECKYWNRNIPQGVVHEVRQVVGDSGSSLGLIISKRGFQKGAVKAAAYSNVMLLSWPDFVKQIHNIWIKGRLFEIAKASRPLFVYLDPLDVPTHLLSDEEKNEYKAIYENYFLFVNLCHQIVIGVLGKAGLDEAFIGHEEESYVDFFKRHITENRVDRVFESEEEYFDFVLANIKGALSEVVPLFQGKDMDDVPLEKVGSFAKELLFDVNELFG